MTKLCTHCRVVKPTTEYYTKSAGRLEGFCKTCKTQKERDRNIAIKAGEYTDATTASARHTSFVESAIKLHGDTYSYENVSYVNNQISVSIFCSKHAGYFLQSPANHLAGSGCKICGVIHSADSRRFSLQEFIEKSKLATTSIYDYAKVVYVNNQSKVILNCSAHGDFTIQAAHHLLGRGCWQCSAENVGRKFTLSTEQFVEKAVLVHGSAYSYAKAEYKGSQTLVTIHCTKCQIDFQQKPANHLSGKGCLECASEKVKAASQALILTTEEFIERATKVHGSLYDYSETVYTKSSEPVTMFCKRHKGYFTQTANSHVQGIGCASCAKTGFSTTKKGMLYILTCGDITKIGITNNGSLERAKSISKSYGGNFSIMREWAFDNGSIPDRVETALLRVLRKKYDRPVARFQGSSEAFMNVDRAWLLVEIDSEIIRQSQSN